MYRKFDRIAVCSNSSREQFLKVLPELSCKTFVVRNCNDYDEIKKMSDEAMIKYNKEFINVLTVSRLSIEKGVERGIKAIAKCIRKGIKVKYHIVGDGPEKKRLEQIAAKYGVEKEINFYGNQIDPYSFMKAADLLLFPSIHEAAGLVVEEARVLKLPILATKTISSQEMILDNDLGWICENNEYDLTKKLFLLLSNPMILKKKKANINTLDCNNIISVQQFNKMINNN